MPDNSESGDDSFASTPAPTHAGDGSSFASLTPLQYCVSGYDFRHMLLEGRTTSLPDPEMVREQAGGGAVLEPTAAVAANGHRVNHADGLPMPPRRPRRPRRPRLRPQFPEIRSASIDSASKATLDRVV